MRERLPRWIAATLLACVALGAPPLPCFAQAGVAGLGHIDDATTVPRGLFRLRGISAWSRFDERFTTNGPLSLGASLTADSLGVRQVPQLASIQSLVESATGRPFTLTLGRSRLGATAREEVVPIGFDYGVTSRLTISFVAPVVRRRVASLFRLDTTGSAANVGPNPMRFVNSAVLANTRVQNEFDLAANQLEARIAACTTNPGATGCSGIAGRQTQAQQLVQSSRAFAADLAALYGGPTSLGSAFVPIAQTSAQDSIAARVASFNTQYKDFLATSTNLLQAVPAAAAGPAGPAYFEGYYTSELGRDSLNLQERIGIGDVEFGFKLGVIDRPRTASRRTGVQMAVASSVRLPSGSRQQRSGIADLRIGGGSVVVDSRVAVDARAGRAGLLAVGGFATSVRDNDTTNSALRSSRWTDIQLAPRWHFAEALSLHGAYSLRSSDKDGGDQLLGGGVTYSTLSAHESGGHSLPMEMRFTHLEAVRGDAGRPKFFRDQIEVRLYFRLR